MKWELNDKKKTNIFSVDCGINRKKEQKTFATMRYAHWCSFPSFFGWNLDQLIKYSIHFLNPYVYNSLEKNFHTVFIVISKSQVYAYYTFILAEFGWYSKVYDNLLSKWGVSHGCSYKDNKITQNYTPQFTKMVSELT